MLEKRVAGQHGFDRWDDGSHCVFQTTSRAPTSEAQVGNLFY
jgi:hypothetical protein